MHEGYKKSNSIPLRQEFVAITGGKHLHALILQQFLYWFERTETFDVILQGIEKIEELTSNIMPRHGWIYKTAKDMTEDLFLPVDKTTADRVRLAIKSLVDAKLIDRRTNPKVKYDRTYQYRPNLKNISLALNKIGYISPGYIMRPNSAENSPVTQHLPIPAIPEWNPGSSNDPLVTQHLPIPAIPESIPAIPGAIPETTIKDNNNNKRMRAIESENEEEQVGEDFIEPDWKADSKSREQVKKLYDLTDDDIETINVEFVEYHEKAKTKRIVWDPLFKGYCERWKKRPKSKSNVNTPKGKGGNIATMIDEMKNASELDKQVLHHAYSIMGPEEFISSGVWEYRIVESNTDCLSIQRVSRTSMSHSLQRCQEIFRAAINALGIKIKRIEFE